MFAGALFLLNAESLTSSSATFSEAIYGMRRTSATSTPISLGRPAAQTPPSLTRLERWSSLLASVRYASHEMFWACNGRSPVHSCLRLDLAVCSVCPCRPQRLACPCVAPFALITPAGRLAVPEGKARHHTQTGRGISKRTCCRASGSAIRSKHLKPGATHAQPFSPAWSICFVVPVLGCCVHTSTTGIP